MNIYFAIFGTVAFLFGTCYGSFLNVCAHRLPRDKSVLWSRSRCPDCDALIKWYDNIPLISFLLLRGQCRNCGGRISASYFLGETVGGLTSLACFIWWFEQGNLDWINYLVTLNFLLLAFVISRIDFSFSIIPNEITYGLIISGLIIGFIPHYPFSGSSSLVLDVNQGFVAFIGTMVGGGLFFLLAIVSPLIYGRPALGMGDVKLMAGFGAWLGPKLILLTIVLGSVIGALIGSFLMLLQGRSLRTEIPFGPFLCIGAVLSLLWGEKLIFWYVNLL